MGMAAPTFFTAEMVLALPADGNRYETVHGELLVTPSPRELHQRVVTRLVHALASYLEEYPVGVVYASPADISWGPDILVQPDVFVAARAEARTGDWKRIRTLHLAIEVRSPSTGRADRFTKRRLYQEVGVPLYWAVDPDERVAEVWTPGDALPLVVRDALVWAPPDAAAPFTLGLAHLLRPV